MNNEDKLDEFLEKYIDYLDLDSNGEVEITTDNDNILEDMLRDASQNDLRITGLNAESKFKLFFKVRNGEILRKSPNKRDYYNKIFQQALTIPDGITGIGEFAFDTCEMLTRVTIPDSVKSIGYCAFSSCSSLENVKIGKNVTSIRSGAFSFCSSLESVKIPNSVTVIQSEAFKDCESLESVTIGKNVTSIESEAFVSCSLTSITIPDNVESIGSYAFANCHNLTEIICNNEKLAKQLKKEYPDIKIICNGKEILIESLNEDTLTKTRRGQTSLKLVMIEVAKKFYPHIDFSEPIKWCIHHLDGNFENNNIENITLMPRGSHTSLHSALRQNDKDKIKSLKPYIYRVGKDLMDKTAEEGEKAEKQDLQEAYTIVTNILDHINKTKNIQEALDETEPDNSTLNVKSKANLSKNLPMTTPYMLRNDGELLECSDVHPYILMSVKSSLETNIETLSDHPDFLDWFYDNTLQEEIKDLIDEYKETNDSDLLEKLNILTNNEFCRVRTSNYKVPYGGDNGQIYFRISSNNKFNWFDLIYNVVLQYDNLDYVTIVKDAQAFKDIKDFNYYKIKGQEVNQMPVEDFLTLQGNPIIESFDHNHEILKHKEKSNMQESVKSNGIYSVLNNEWIKEPVQADIPDINQEEFDKLFKEWEDKYFDLLDSIEEFE